MAVVNVRPVAAEPGDPAPPEPRSGGGALRWVGVVVLVASAIFGSNAFSVRDRLLGSATPKPAAPVASRVAGAAGADASGTPPVTAPVQATSLRSQPWWQDVATLEGTGAMTSSPFTIGDRALQWRVTWSCDAGHLVILTPKRPKAIVDAACPSGAPGYAVATGPMSVAVKADGPWHLQVAQQIDAPLVEPPLPAMTASGASVVATGPLYRIDQNGMGKVTIYHLADGRYSLRLEDVFVSPTTDLELRMSTIEAPHSSSELAAAASALVSPMDITAGSLNFAVPSTVDPTRFRSLYVWCALTRSAYAAASLAVPR